MTTSGGADGSRYINREKLGDGTYGCVFRALDSVTGGPVALKIQSATDKEGIPRWILRELSIAQAVDHPNVVSFKEAFAQDNSFILVTDYLPYDLRRLLSHSTTPITPQLMQSYAFQVLCGVYQLHSHGIIHRDLKPENLLLDQDGGLKICDFGLSRFVTLPLVQYTPGLVSVWYKAPELLCGSPAYDLSSDVWSIGCILAEMATGTALAAGDSDIDQLQKIFAVLGTPTREELEIFQIDPDLGVTPRADFGALLRTKDRHFVDLCARMLRYDPGRRITVAEALRHPYFDTICETIKGRCGPPDIEPLF
jgi:serine/threonine protein kinase